MRIVLDTNVIVAAFATRGLCAEVFEICLTDHTIILSEHILYEIEKNVIKKISLPDKMVRDIIGHIRNNSDIVEPEVLIDSICRDKDDVKIIGTALKGNARFIITGDDDLLSLKKYGDIVIVTPREFWDFLKG
jgi:putative PIN family toxin of toxin-antitoxin system